MDIWSVVNWDIAYTEENKIAYDLNRRLSTVSALFYLVDQEFIRIRTETAEEPSKRIVSTANQPFEVTEAVMSALVKRSINIAEYDAEQLTDGRRKAERYLENKQLQDKISADALALYFVDKERLSWLANEDVQRIVDDIDRAKRQGNI